MSTLKCNNAQIGQSGTASNNFTWYQPTVPDGTVRLGQGNSGATTSDILVVSSTGLAIGGSSIPAERIVQGTAQTTSGANAYGYTGIPSWVKKITMNFYRVTTTSTSVYFIVQIGSGSYTSSGYVSKTFWGTSSEVNTSGFFIVNQVSNSADPLYGQIVLVNQGSNIWTSTSLMGASVIGVGVSQTGGVTLSGALDRIQLTAGSNFSQGSVNIIYEG